MVTRSGALLRSGLIRVCFNSDFWGPSPPVSPSPLSYPAGVVFAVTIGIAMILPSAVLLIADGRQTLPQAGGRAVRNDVVKISLPNVRRHS